MKSQPQPTTEESLSTAVTNSSRPGLRIPVAALGAIGFASLLSSAALSQAVAGALQGFGFICLGLAGAILFGLAWWYRLPIRFKGGLSPDRPFFYHLGSAFFLGASLLLVIAGASQLRGWLAQ